MNTMPPHPFAFASRTAWDTSESVLATAIASARAAGKPLIDLTLSNPTRCGFEYDGRTILSALSHPSAMFYTPDPCGLLSAREAVAAYYASHQAFVSPDQILLTTSTSEAYTFLFRLLCNPGDEVLVAQPSYPLFHFLADLNDLRLVPYPLFYDFGWCIDFDQLERRITPRTRAILLVHPNNPTGHATSRQERERLQQICVSYGLALVIDEVFLDYALDEPIPSFATGEHPALTFVVSGISKILALPQMKVAWLAAFGPDALRLQALSPLEIIADTMLSLNAPAQYALPIWLESRASIHLQIMNRIRHNLALIQESSIPILPVQAGWTALLRLPTFAEQPERWLTRIIEEAQVIVHPGSFYGLDSPGRVVLSLIGPSPDLAAGLQRLSQWCESNELTAPRYTSSAVS